MVSVQHHQTSSDASLSWVNRVGERGRNRTFNLLIKSQLLCQLSYAPTRSRSDVRRDKLIIQNQSAMKSASHSL
jgi:hypothetical protein